ncbi:DUF6029 family protein [Lutimonas sp.]|uniref:DUF6029 family protein n=1 Tax=Lutimonas sp. TaxID=1872403 RepID=UPI003D9ADE5A
MPLKSFIVFIIIISSHELCAQFIDNFSGSLESQSTLYTDDDKIVNPGSANFRSNNYLRFNYFRNSFKASIQFESYVEEALLGYSPDLDQKFGFSMASVGYSTKKFQIEAGYLFDQMSSGLSYRSWEDRQLGLNNALVGSNIQFSPTKKLLFKAFIGKQKNAFDLSQGTLMGFNSAFKLGAHVDIDLGIISRYEAFESDNPEFSEFTNLFSSKIAYHKGSFYTNMEAIYKGDDALVEFGNVIDSRLFTGNALLFNLGFFKSGFGFDITFRRLENMAFYTDREAYANIYNQLIVNYIPALTKQHNVGLSNIYVYQAQPQLSFIAGGKAGEIGHQIDLYYKFSKENSLAQKFGTVLAFNYASWFGLNADFDLENRSYSAAFFEYGEEYYTDINFELRNQWSDQWRSSVYWIHQFYNRQAIEASTGTVTTNIAAVDGYYTINQKHELRFQIEHLWTQDDKKNWAGGLVEYNFLRKFSIYINDQYNYGNDNDIERIHYYNFGGTYRHKKTKFTINYGRQRGGLICVGGVCRFVPKSNGLSIGMNLFI